MQEIKFRVYDDGLGKMIYFDIKSANDTVDCTIYDEIMQYTGLKDKNDKEIYDGDIAHVFVTSSPLIKVVEWVNDKEYCINPGFVLANGDGGKSGFMPFSQYRVKIIGNRFENPELIIKIKAMKEKSEFFSYMD